MGTIKLFDVLPLLTSLSMIMNSDDEKPFFDRDQTKLARQISVKLERYAFYKSITYVFTLGVSGLCISAFGSEMSTLAMNVSSNPQILSGWLFFLRGSGTTTGSLTSSILYSRFEGNHILALGLLLEVVTVLLIFYASTLPMLELCFYLNGFLGGLNDAGAAILMRKTQGKNAGPWMSVLGIGFALFASLYPAIAMLFSNLKYRVLTVVGLILILCLAILFGVQMAQSLDPEDAEHVRAIGEELRSNQSSHKDIYQIAPHYRVELGLAFVAFVLVGCQLNLAANFVVYAQTTNVVSDSSLKALLFFFWLLLAIGRILGVLDQRGLVHDSAVVIRLVCCTSLAAASFVPILLFPHSAMALWVGICLFSFFYAPGTGYCFDLNNRLTLPTELSTSIILTGINFGSCVMPYATPTLWAVTGTRPELLMLLCFITLAMTVPVVYFTRSWSYSRTLPGFVLSRESTYYDYDSVSKHRFRVAATAVRAMMKMVNMRRKSHTEEAERQSLLESDGTAEPSQYGSSI